LQQVPGERSKESAGLLRRNTLRLARCDDRSDLFGLPAIAGRCWRWTLKWVLLIAIAASALAQPSAEEKGLPATFHCGDREDLPMTHHDKACYWWTHSFNAPMILGAAFNGALDPLVNNSTNAYWGQGMEAFGRRFGTRVSQSMAKGTGQALVGVIFKE